MGNQGDEGTWKAFATTNHKGVEKDMDCVVDRQSRLSISSRQNKRISDRPILTLQSVPGAFLKALRNN